MILRLMFLGKISMMREFSRAARLDGLVVVWI